ncbi:Glyoxal reductase [Sporomusa ovata DSM 2662]|uniref:Oxidoreductase of aldo/keto reductase family, subgroup 1 n=1 Tax=Sporomusa ovata TaxID=2378 RepID=A0A0U1KV07_9FIRM|nr:aldo/keto reductase [Sporomusa ovata]EQB26440.1 oxidoreductase, aldo/keto reductase family [Sporomusa ovata DSM 2662]CQR70524.1 oxidoreductase of aldo/keto reductase family, subgroup 1 [Sporomusa ovata]
MQERLVLNNGMSIPAQGFGTYSYTDNLSEIVALAAKAGVRLFDTSDDYHNEAFLGDALRKTFERREDYTVITKFTMPTHPHEVEQLLRKSLVNLFGDDSSPVDLYLMHWPFPNVYLSIWKEMERVYDKGLCKGIGVCNFNIEHLEKLRKHAHITPAINQFELHPLFNQKELCDYCAANGIQVMCYTPLARMHPDLMNNQVLMQLGKKYSKSVVQIILRWDYQKHYIAIPAASKQKHIENNVNILDFNLSETEIALIDGLHSGLRVRNNPDTYFSSKQKLKFFLANSYYKVMGAKSLRK